MKNVIFLCVTLCTLVFLNACNKDLDLKSSLQDQQSEVDPALKRSCGTNDHMNTLLQDADYRTKHEDKFRRLAKMSTERFAQCNNPTILPVAVHFQGVSNPDPACLKALAQTQIDIINNDYAGTNADISNWTQTASASFPGLQNGEACLKFCIASKNHPSGFNLSNGDPAVTINQTTGDSDGAWSGYINIFVQFGTGVLGYSPLGGSGNGDGVVVDASAFGAGNGCGTIAPQSPYDLGRTLTHELGHYLLLDHVWGGNGGCNDDDGVEDTPVTTQPYYGCPNIGASSCNSTDLHMDYMDYTNDACMYMFSQGQAVRMENYVASSLQNVVNNASNVCEEDSGPTEPTCSDGVQNGQETGVDCGGPVCQPCGVGNCDTPINIKAEVLGTSAALIAWDEVPGAHSYWFQYREAGTSNWNIEEVQQASITLTNLSTETTYEFQVRSLCSELGTSPFTSIQTFTTVCDGGGGHDCDGTAVTFQLILDDYGSETSWELINEYNEIVGAGSGYEDGATGTSISEDFCLEDGCYFVVVYDEYGDGICCLYGEGSFRLIDADGNVVAESDGEFGYYDYLDFCVENGNVESFSFRTDPRSAAKNTQQKG